MLGSGMDEAPAGPVMAVLKMATRPAARASAGGPELGPGPA